MSESTSILKKMMSLRCLLGTILLIAGCVFWTSITYTSVFHYKFNSGDESTRESLLCLYPLGVATITGGLVIVYWLCENFLRYSLSRIRFILTILAVLIAPFMMVVLITKFGNLPKKLNVTEIQRIRFGEYGAFLENADRITLYSIEPFFPEEGENVEPLFHRYSIIGSIEIRDSAVIDLVWKDLKGRVYSEYGWSYTECFNPRHGIRAFQGDSFKDYLICFSCHHLYVYDSANSEHQRIGLEGDKVSILLNSLLDKEGVIRNIPKR